MSELNMQYSDILNLTLPEMAMLLDAFNNLSEKQNKAQKRAYKNLSRGF